MLTYTDLPLIPTQVIGSHGIPGWVWVIQDAIAIEFANRGMFEIELWEKYGADKVLCAGVIDVKGRDLEQVEVVVDRIRTALRHCAPEKLWVAPDCGFSQTVRWLAVEKMKVMVRATSIVREEIG